MCSRSLKSLKKLILYVRGEAMKCILLIVLLSCAVSTTFARQLDLKRFQYPVEDAKKSAQSPVPRFCTFIAKEGGKPRLPGVGTAKGKEIISKHRTQLMNEYRLYKKGEVDYQEKVLLERYCTRYNRVLVNELGL